MAILNKNSIQKNIFILLDYSGLSDINFAYLLGVSDRQIKRIKKGKAEFSIDNINKACDFFDQSLKDINSDKVVLPPVTLRENLINIHKTNTEYSSLLDKRPTITYAINFELLHNKIFKSSDLTVKEIDQIFRDKQWVFTSSYISLALSRNKDRIKSEPHPTKKGTFVYSKK